MSSQTQAPPEHDYAAMRRVMVESQLRPSDVSDGIIIGAMTLTPREPFVPQQRRQTCYRDRPVPLGRAGRTLNPPLATGLLLDRAAVRRDDNVLVVGSATGYVAALLAPLVSSVTALEDDTELADAAKEPLAGFANITAVRSDLAAGCAANAPYSLIVIDGAAEVVPQALIDQLSEEGRMVTGLLQDGITRLAIGRKTHGGFGLNSFAESEITPLPQFAAPRTYRF